MKAADQKERASLQEHEIRPDNIQADLAECYEADLSWLTSRSKEFQDSACPACSGSARVPLFTKDGFQYHTCGDCGTAYISPRPSPAVLGDFYAVSHVYKLFLNRIFPASQEIRRQEFFRPRVNRIVEACIAAGMSAPAMLEVGSAFGIFCEEAMSRGFFSSVTGVEPNREMASKCRSKGIRVVEKMIEDVIPEEVGPLDVICAFEVIEHLLEPQKFLASCRNLIRKEGLLFLTCPNGKGFDLSMLGSLSETYNFEHLNYFNPESLSLLLEKCGFHVLHIRTPGKMDVDLVRKAALAGRIDLGGDAFLKRVLLEEYDVLGVAFQKFLAANQLSGHMEVIAKVRDDAAA